MTELHFIQGEKNGGEGGIKSRTPVLDPSGADALKIVPDNFDKPSIRVLINIMAVREGFEPSKRFRLHTFQACAFDHSATSPYFSRYIFIKHPV